MLTSDNIKRDYVDGQGLFIYEGFEPTDPMPYTAVLEHFNIPPCSMTKPTVWITQCVGKDRYEFKDVPFKELVGSDIFGDKAEMFYVTRDDRKLYRGWLGKPTMYCLANDLPDDTTLFEIHELLEQDIKETHKPVDNRKFVDVLNEQAVAFGFIIDGKLITRLELGDLVGYLFNDNTTPAAVYAKGVGSESATFTSEPESELVPVTDTGYWLVQPDVLANKQSIFRLTATDDQGDKHRWTVNYAKFKLKDDKSKIYRLINTSGGYCITADRLFLQINDGNKRERNPVEMFEHFRAILLDQKAIDPTTITGCEADYFSVHGVKVVDGMISYEDIRDIPTADCIDIDLTFVNAFVNY